jgi:hypothetical protein
LDSVRDGIQSCGFKLGDMEGRVYGSYSLQKADGEGMRA